MGFISKAVGSIFGTGDTQQAGQLVDQGGALVDRANAGYRENQWLANALQQQAMGGGPANDIFNNNLAQGIQAAGSTIASTKGINSGLAARLAGQQAAKMSQDAVAQRAGMQLQAQQLYGQNNLAQQQINQGAIASQNAANAGLAQENNRANSNAVSNILGGAASAATMFLNEGGIVPGSPEVKGDSPKNDKVPAKLSPGEIVIPRSILKDPEQAPKKAAAFVEKLLEKKKKDGPKGYAKVLAARKALNEFLGEGDE